MEELSDSEVQVLAYLLSLSGQAVPESHVSKNVDNARAALNRLLDRRLVEYDEDGRYRLVPPKRVETTAKFIAPHIREILIKANIRPVQRL